MKKEQEELERQARLVDKLRGDLEQRLAALHKAPAYRKLEEGRYVAAAVFEILHAQNALNAGLVASIAELRGEYDAVCRELERGKLTDQDIARGDHPAARL